jgi:hypothetical protein
VSKTGLPATTSVLNGAQPLLNSLGPFLEQLNPILTWLSLHQQLTSDFISQGASALAAQTTLYGGAQSCGGQPCGHYLAQFAPQGNETGNYQASRDPNARGNAYPPPLWLANPLNFTAGGQFPGATDFPAWDCTPAGGQTAGNSSEQPCWVAPPIGQLLGEATRFAQVKQASYSSH